MITLSKIAKEAHVSVSTASKAFSGSPEVNEDTREQVFRVAKEYGCFKKFYNAKYPKLVIAVIAPEFSGMYYTRYLSLIQQNLSNCELCVSTTNFSAECEQSLIDYYYKHSNADGIILIDPITQLHTNIEVPVAVLGKVGSPREPHSDYPCVYTNIAAALLEALNYLKGKGITSVGFLGENRTGSKQNLFIQLTKQLGLRVDDNHMIRTDQRFEEGGYHAMELLLRQKKRPRAVVCTYDHMAIGAMRCLTDHGMRIPEDMAILGMDDIPEARFLNPPLASISSAHEERCRVVSEAILQRINGESVDSDIILPARFQLRRSFIIQDL